ncbi:MAG: glycine cleavage system aminomethyltransferase GcvT [Planctomycetota bacterium]
MSLHKTPLHDFHVDHGGQMVEYAGWEMPMKYTGIIPETQQVRSSGGLFDVSHMGRVEIKGLHARRLLERTCTRRINGMQDGRCRYTLICNERGGVKDDALIYRHDDDDYLMVCNGANREKIVSHLEAVAAEREYKVQINDKTLKTSMIAAQGPKVRELISGVSKEIPSLKRYQFTTKNLVVVKLLVSRTGYTGEDGVEVILPAGMTGMAMKLLTKDVDLKSDDAVMKPAGLGARDTLRIEAGMPLHGHARDEDPSALTAGLGFAMALDKTEEADGATFIGQEALLKEQEAGGPPRMLAGLELEGKRTPRQGMPIEDSTGAVVGTVTSGCSSPTLGKPIAMAMVDTAHTEPGTELVVDLGRAKAAATVVPLPFYKAPK